MRHWFFWVYVFTFSFEIYSQTLSVFKDANGKYGYKNENEAVVVPALYDLALPESEYFLAVNKGYKEIIENGAPKVLAWGKWGFLNSRGEQLIPFKYDMVKPVTNGHFVANIGAKPYGNEWLTGGKWGSIDLLQKILLPFNYDMIRFSTGDKWLVNTGGKFYFNANGVLPDKVQTGKWGIAGNDGKEITKPAYASLELAWENNFIAQDPVSKKFGLLSYEGLPKIPFDYDLLFDFCKGAALAKKAGKYGFIGTQNQLIIPFIYDEVYEKDLYAGNHVLVKKDGRTFSIDASGKEIVKSPEPFESDYQKAFINAADTKERVMALNNYFVAIRKMPFADDQLQYVVEGKFRQLLETDFYALYSFYLDQAAIKDDKRAFATTYRSLKNMLTKEQFGMFDFYSEYNIGQAEARIYNQTTGQTTIAPKIDWMINAPRPGYGWGKLVSSDKVKTNQAAANKPAVVSPTPVYIPSEAEALIGHSYYKDTSYTDVWGDFYSASVICDVQSIVGDYANVLYFLSNNSTIKNGKLPWKVFTQYQSVYKPLEKYYNTCRKCDGKGTMQTTSTYSHTNDYQYTLGVKQIFTSTSTSTRACSNCDGAGICPSDGSASEWRKPYYQKKRKY